MTPTFLILIFLLALSVSSCVLPNRLAEDNPFGEQFIGFIEPGSTSGTEVETQLGNPHQLFSDGRWWVFHADRRMTEWFWFFCVQTGCGGSEFGGDVQLYSLIIELDEQDVVKSSAVVTEKRPCTRDQTLCYSDGKLTALEDGMMVTGVLDKTVHSGQRDAQPDRMVDVRFTVTLDNERQTDLIERNGLIYEVGATDPFTGHVTLSEVRGIKGSERAYEAGMLNGAETFYYKTGEKSYRLHYVDNALHGPITSWERDGSIIFQGCYAKGTFVDLSIDECQP